jgi:hypothetical protein
MYASRTYGSPSWWLSAGGVLRCIYCEGLGMPLKQSGALDLQNTEVDSLIHTRAHLRDLLPAVSWFMCLSGHGVTCSYVCRNDQEAGRPMGIAKCLLHRNVAKALRDEATAHRATLAGRWANKCSQTQRL